MANYINRLKNKLKIKKLDSEQPIKAWIFVIFLNLVGFAGYFYLKINNIHLSK
tara:strand:- start:217 stop:375 length:159 start_codon:yes stop_codon:yes gene_type:complete